MDSTVETLLSQRIASLENELKTQGGAYLSEIRDFRNTVSALRESLIRMEALPGNFAALEQRVRQLEADNLIAKGAIKGASRTASLLWVVVGGGVTAALMKLIPLVLN